YDRNRGVYAGFDQKTKSYPYDHFDYDRDGRGNPRKDDELRNPRTVFQLLKKHVSVYTPQYVSECTGCPVDSFLQAAEYFCESAGPLHSGAVVIGGDLGGDLSTEQTYRAVSILQLILGNIGMSGAGIYQSESFGNSLGVDYQIPSWGSLPGMVALPGKGKGGDDTDFTSYVRNHMPTLNNPSSLNFWQNLKSYAVALLRSWYGDKGTESTRYNFDWIPKGSHDFTTDEWLSSFGKKYKGALFLGADLAAYGVSKEETEKALSSLSWLVVSDIWHTDSSDFWKNKNCDTEVFLLPSMTLYEKEGTVLNSSRWIEKRDSLPPANTGCRSEFQIMDSLFAAVKKGCGPASSLPEQITYASWNYPDELSVLREMSGFRMHSGKKGISSIDEIREDGSIACGNIFFCGSYPGEPYARTTATNGATSAKIFPSWGYSIPGNVRVLYNGAGLDRSGFPIDRRRRVVSISDSFSGKDELHGIREAGSNPFVMNREGVASLFAQSLPDGPFPDQYESPSGVARIPVHPRLTGTSSPRGSVRAICIGESRYALERIPLESEFSLSGICEIHTSLAAAKKIVTGDKVRISSASHDLIAQALVTDRISRFATSYGSFDWVILRGGAFRFLAGNIHEGIISVTIEKSAERKDR
ncbi:MAG TPA: hypothetical protein VF857_05990, partial [Spirochaetota bacterium]